MAMMLLPGIIFLGGFDMKQKKIKVLMVEPGNHPTVTELGNTLDSLQEAVSLGASYIGLIEIFLFDKDNIVILCNEEGKLNGLVGNRRINGDIIAGVFYICAEDEQGNLTSLSPEDMERYKAMFWNPEYYTENDVQNSLYYTIKEWKL